MGIFQKVRWTMHLTGHLGYFLLFAIHGYVLNLSVILAQVSLSSAFEVSENPKPEQQKELRTYFRSMVFVLLCPEETNLEIYISTISVFKFYHHW